MIHAAPVADLGEFVERAEAGTAAGAGQVGLHPIAQCGFADEARQLGGVDPVVPDVQLGECGELPHRPPVRPGRRQGGCTGAVVAVAVVTGGHRDAGGEPLDVPFEGSGVGLVEIVEVEEQGAFGRGEHAEVQEVRVPAQLDGQAGLRLGGQVGGHDGGRAAQEGER